MARGRAEHFPAAQFARLNGVFIVVHGVLNFHLHDTMGASGRQIKIVTARCKQICCCAAQHLLFWCTPRATWQAAAGCASSGFTSHKNAPARELSRKLRWFLFCRRALKMRQSARDRTTTMAMSDNNAENGWTTRAERYACAFNSRILSAGGRTAGMDVKFCGRKI